MTKERDVSCPDCNKRMKAIAIIDHGVQPNRFGGPGFGMPEDSYLQYGLRGERRDSSGKLPAQGVVARYMCEDCGRILLYGVPTTAHPLGRK